eukprot:Phypoly_transcript_08292.p1 GENE.Phypoly_transcript_08292~~Phypoly_transcript_08292.p1  ORF type:complete len:452 (+),score=48.45 Phypoly_transcript_08292:101-1456(+)
MRGSNLTGKIFLRLSLFVILYVAYLSAFSYFAETNITSSSSWLPSLSSNFLPTLQTSHKKYSQTICSNNEKVDELFQNFLPVHTQHLANMRTTGKFIVYAAIDTTGLGNRIPPLVATFLLALITNRGFLVHWPHVNQSINTEQELVGMAAFRRLFDTPFLYDLGQIPQFYDTITRNNTLILSLELMADAVLCGDLEETYGHFPFIVIYGWRPFFDLIFQNPAYSQRVKELGLQDLVHDIARCLLLPVPAVHEVIRNFKTESKIGENTKVVGIHIRKFGDHGLTKKEEAALWECVREKHPPPPLPPFDPNWSNLNASVLYFLATDHAEVITRAPPEFRPYVVTMRAEKTRHSIEGLIRAIADMWILGQTVEVYGAQGTTFLAATRTLFDTPTNLLVGISTLSHSKSKPLHCVQVGPLPCFKWWDVFRAHKNFTLSCFIQHAPMKSNLSSLVC